MTTTEPHTIVGDGNAALTAAIAAHEGGAARVIVLDAAHEAARTVRR